jgi:hypothetical protein
MNIRVGCQTGKSMDGEEWEDGQGTASYYFQWCVPLITWKDKGSHSLTRVSGYPSQISLGYF